MDLAWRGINVTVPNCAPAANRPASNAINVAARTMEIFAGWV